MGDAAAVVDPAAGQGVFFALHSGMVAARAILDCINQPQLEPLHLAYTTIGACGSSSTKLTGCVRSMIR